MARNSQIVILLAVTFLMASGVFVRAGVANSRINKFGYHIGAGVVYVGPLAGREEDIVGIAFAHAHSGEALRRFMVDQGTLLRSGELTAEITYCAQVTPWLAVQPNVQHVIHPSADAVLGSATVLGGRIEVSF